MSEFRVRWLTVVMREQVATVHGFDREEDARAFFDASSAQWSDSYLTRVLIGPQFHAEPPLTDRERACLRGDHEAEPARPIPDGAAIVTTEDGTAVRVCRHCRCGYVPRKGS